MDRLYNKGLFDGNCFVFDELPSTNDYLIDNLNFHHEGDVIWTKHQTKGRGRNGKTWYSQENKSLTFSYLLKKKNYPINNLAQVLSLSLCQYLKKEYEIDTFMKWPNDILMGDHKVSGLLVEVKDDYFIVGHGINLFNDEIFLKNINQKSKGLFSDNSIDILSFLLGYIPYVEMYLINYRKESFGYFYNELISHYTMIGKEGYVSVNGDGNKKKVFVSGLLRDGTLEILDIETNKKEVISSGDVWI